MVKGGVEVIDHGTALEEAEEEVAEDATGFPEAIAPSEIERK